LQHVSAGYVKPSAGHVYKMYNSASTNTVEE